MPNVAICIPSFGDWKPRFALDVMKLMITDAQDTTVEIMWEGNSILPQGRQKLAARALLNKCTHILWLDADMRFPPDTLKRLLDRGKMIVGANYTQRNPPYLPTASHNGQRISSKGRHGMQEVDYLGFGVCLMDTCVFDKIEPPWFMFGYNPKSDHFVGEDAYFFTRAKRAGFLNFIDHDLSQKVKHIGEIEIDCEMEMSK